MDYPEKENIERHLRKKHKDWSEEKIEAEAKEIWHKYFEQNKERLEDQAKENLKKFNESVDREFLNLLMDSHEDDF